VAPFIPTHFFFNSKEVVSQVPVAHTSNPSYSGGRDQEDHGWKPAWANHSQDPILKKTPSQKKASEVAQGVGPELKPQYHQKNKKRVVRK
jgi:hypothetical protein